MANHPLLFFPEPTTAERRKPPGGGGSLRKPTAAQQRARLDARFRAIADSFHDLQGSVHGLEPEQVLVLETVGDTVEGLAKAAAHIPGLEWLGEMDLDDVLPEEGFRHVKDPDKLLSCRLYAVMTNQQAMDQLIGLWDSWCSDPKERAARNFGPFKNLFINLRDLRRWDAEDRIQATGILEYLNERLDDGTEEIRFEVELWCRHSSDARQRAYDALTSLVSENGGLCVTQSTVPEILYHGVLVRMPAASVRATVDAILAKSYGSLIRCEDVMYFRPFAQAGFAGDHSGMDADGDVGSIDAPLPSGPPLIAVLDGLPLEQHESLRGRLIIDDAENYAQRHEARDRHHGTAMASLVVHGDLNSEDGAPLAAPVFLRPILVPARDFDGNVREVIPDDELLVDLVHRTVRSLFEGDSPVAPTVKVVNLSVANSFQPFDRELSPLARLLDWLAWKYKILFVVSVGNHPDPVVLSVSREEWQELTAEERCAEAIHTLYDDQLSRRPFSPAESLNALTVGALHADDSSVRPGDRRIDLLAGIRFPSPIGAISSGLHRSIKPEIYLPGGRQLYHEKVGPSQEPAEFRLAQSQAPPGQKVAAPPRSALELTRTTHTRGTSNATALATRFAGQIFERLQAIRDEPGGDRLDEAELAVLLKCLIVHASSWNDGAERLRSVFQEEIDGQFDAKRAWREMDRILCRFLGYGEVSSDVSQFSTDERVTIVGWAEIAADEGHIFHVPLPPALSGIPVRRRLTGTLAWLSPQNPRHRKYREAALWFHVDPLQIGVKKSQVDSDTARRGTVEHRILEGEKVAAFDDGETLEVLVSCRSDAGKLTEVVPYALAITLEVAEPLDISIFEQIRDRIRPRVEIGPDR